ncbi:hypothetical protein L1987_72817 [Smallanthus sonchifolius]|uniref:Uncharacterized protein n=1 Tax=Smallanthus sonchifolius TaxID=185202 RepID=A0ACB9B0Q0_9ASTR|nr:hypothetical protein L1987_72817 [Smallanthus sonchifolius]
MKAYSVSQRAGRSTSATGLGECLFPRVNHFKGSSRLGTQSKPVTPLVLGSIGPAGSTDGSVGILDKYHDFKHAQKDWCDKQCLLVGAAAYTVFVAFDGAVFGLVWRFFIHHCVDMINIDDVEQAKPYFGIYYPLAISMVGGPYLTARSYAVLAASIEGISYVMKRLRGEEDLLSRQEIMVVGFGTAVIYSLVSGMRSPIFIIANGLIIALVCGFIFKATKESQTDDDGEYRKRHLSLNVKGTE